MSVTSQQDYLEFPIATVKVEASSRMDYAVDRIVQKRALAGYCLVSLVICIWSIWFVWLSSTNQMNKTNQINQVNPPPRLDRVETPTVSCQ
jgi:hypothetical protein